MTKRRHQIQDDEIRAFADRRSMKLNDYPVGTMLCREFIFAMD
jgi:hypothetical protein